MRYLPSDLLPSHAAHLAARSRVNASRKAALQRAERRDRYYPPITASIALAAPYGTPSGFHTYDRPRDCLYPNAGRDVRYIGSNGNA